VATTAVLPLLPEKIRYPKLGAYPKYGAFTLQRLGCGLDGGEPGVLSIHGKG
jgi:hypothetical protein